MAADGSGCDGSEIVCIDGPEIPLDVLKNLTVEMLTAAVRAVGQGVRDPEGGSIELLLVPLVRLFYILLVMGVFGDEDLGKVLRLIEPEVFSRKDESSEKKEEEEGSDDECENEWEAPSDKEDDTPKRGLLQMKLPEAVKLEVNQQTSLTSSVSALSIASSFGLFKHCCHIPIKTKTNPEENGCNFLCPALPGDVLPVRLPGAPQSGGCSGLLRHLCGPAAGESVLPLQ